jgi:predicted nucleic acid-binding protein
VICLDTNYLILGLVSGSRQSREIATWFAAGERLVAPTLVWVEFLCGPVTEAQVRTMRAFLHELVPFDEPQAITAAHLLSDAKLPDIQADIKVWRRHIAATVGSVTHCMMKTSAC